MKGEPFLIIKPREIPLKILKLSALLRRLRTGHPKIPEIEEELRIAQAGYRGEQAIDYYISFLPNDIYVLHSLRLQDNRKLFFQIDTLIITPCFILIFEVKNIFGTLYFDPVFHQLYRVSNSSEDGFKDPITQAERLQSQLASWLRDHKIAPIPIISQIVISHPTTIIKTTVNDPELKRKIIHAALIPQKFDSFSKSLVHPHLTHQECKKLGRLLAKHHTPLDINILNKLQINPSDIIKGPHCPKCFAIPMKKRGKTWYCSDDNCDYHCKDPLPEALGDFALLYGPQITNQQFRDFMGTKSISVASKYLTSLNLEYMGTYKNRVYILPFPPKNKEK